MYMVVFGPFYASARHLFWGKKYVFDPSLAYEPSVFRALIQSLFIIYSLCRRASTSAATTPWVTTTPWSSTTDGMRSCSARSREQYHSDTAPCGDSTIELYLFRHHRLHHTENTQLYGKYSDITLRTLRLSCFIKPIPKQLCVNQ